MMVYIGKTCHIEKSPKMNILFRSWEFKHRFSGNCIEKNPEIRTSSPETLYVARRGGPALYVTQRRGPARILLKRLNRSGRLDSWPTENLRERASYRDTRSSENRRMVFSDWGPPRAT